MKLIKPTDAELNDAFAEHVCGMKLVNSETWGKIWISTDVGGECYMSETRNWICSADAVLPWLEKQRAWMCEKLWESDKTRIIVHVSDPRGASAEADTMPRAAVIALLRAHGAEVEP